MITAASTSVSPDILVCRLDGWTIWVQPRRGRQDGGVRMCGEAAGEAPAPYTSQPSFAHPTPPNLPLWIPFFHGQAKSGILTIARCRSALALFPLFENTPERRAPDSSPGTAWRRHRPQRPRAPLRLSPRWATRYPPALETFPQPLKMKTNEVVKRPPPHHAGPVLTSCPSSL